MFSFLKFHPLVTNECLKKNCCQKSEENKNDYKRHFRTRIFCLPTSWKVKCKQRYFFPTWGYFLNIFFLVWLPPFGVFIIIVLFCHQEVRFIHLVFRRTQEMNSRPRTMAQTESSTFTTRPGSFPNVDVFY